MTSHRTLWLAVGGGAWGAALMRGRFGGNAVHRKGFDRG
jgi:hypothetical protein